jgi:dTDP-4-dehydrorhamnose 3,5-epimerase
MRIIETSIIGLLVIEPDVFTDTRGYFFESYNRQKWSNYGIDHTFIQDNESLSSYGVVRGLHFQLAPWSQAKLVRAVSGAVFDVALDLRRESPTFGKWYGLELSVENKLQLLIPRGFAHGFSVLTPEAVFAYKCDNQYNKPAERAIYYNDPLLAIDWRIPVEKQLVSDKDLQAPVFNDCEMNF